MLGQLSETRNHAQSIVEVSESINKAGVAILDNWGQCVLGQSGHVCLSGCDFATAKQLLMLLEMCLDFVELGKECVVLQNLEIFDVEVSLIVTLEFLSGLTRVNTLENAQTSKITQGDLHVADCI